MQHIPFALNVNGTNGYSDHGNVYAKARTDSWSTSFWCRVAVDGTLRFLVCKRSNSSPFTGWSISTQNGRIGLQLVANAAANHLYAQSVLNASMRSGVWHHVVVTYAGTSAVSGVKIYIDGVSVTIATVANTLGTADIVATTVFRLGSAPEVGAVLIGSLTMVRMHSRVLTAAEVLDLYYDDLDAAPDGAALMTDGSGTTLTGTGTMPNGTITTPAWTTETPMRSRSTS